VRAFRRFSFLVPIVTCVGISNAGNMMVRSLLLLLTYRAFALPPSAAGWVLAAGGLAGVAGAPLASKVGARVGLGAALVLSTFVEGAAWCLAPLGLLGHPQAVLIGAALISGVMTPIWNVNSVTLRQRAVPLELQTRVVALARAVGFGTIPVGTVVGGGAAALLINAGGTRIGLTAAVVIGGLVASSSAIPLLLGRIPAVRVPDAQNRAVASVNL
jgi:MFS family permease